MNDPFTKDRDLRHRSATPTRWPSAYAQAGLNRSHSGQLSLRNARPSSSLVGSFLRVIAVCITIGVVGAVAGVWIWLGNIGVLNLDAERLRLITTKRAPDNTLVYDRNGEQIGEFFSTYHVYTPLAEVPKHLIDALLATEDKDFYTHPGFDLRAITRAGVVRLRGQETRQGASTITQQVVRHFLLTRDKTITRKVQEIALAWHLEQKVPKAQILEIYVNTFFLGNGAYGVGAAAWRYFGKPLKDLEPHESALIAGLFQSPSRFNPTRHPERAKARQRQVIRSLLANRTITSAEARAMVRKPLVYKTYEPLNEKVAPWFVDHIREEATRLMQGRMRNLDGRGLRIHTTLDSNLQSMAERAIADAGPDLEKARRRTTPLRGPKGERIYSEIEAALMTVDPKTGEVLAMVGGRDYAKTQFNRTTAALRSPGSSFKPVVFSLALQNGRRWSDMLFVSPINFDSYRPRNPTGDFLTETTLLRAFFRSMNTPTVELGQSLGLARVIDQAKRLGIRSPIKNEIGTMLGSSDVTMPDLARMFSAFANSGRLVEQTSITRITDRAGKELWAVPPPARRTTDAISPQVAFLMTQGMRNVLAMGTGFRSAALADFAAGKTGTANNSTDNWFSGYTTELATVVWVGTDQHVGIHGEDTGATLALPIWDDFMTKASTLRPGKSFPVPAGVMAARVHPNYGHVSSSGIRMWFMRGREPESRPSALEALSHSKTGAYRDVFAN